MNLIEGIQAEMNRNRELLTEYEKIGPAGMFGAIMIKQQLIEGDRVIAEGDTIGMLQIYEELKNTK